MIDGLLILGALLLAVFFAVTTWLMAHEVSESRKDAADEAKGSVENDGRSNSS